LELKQKDLAKSGYKPDIITWKSFLYVWSHHNEN
jgi:hypothetical protein